ncbi:MAG: beta strand repeat-containing protein, partial [Alphaproteobacteria bacterium]
MSGLSRLLLLSSAMASVSLSANALNECGTVAVGGSITCAAGTYSQIEYRIKDVTVTLDNGVSVENSTRGVQIGQSTGDMGNITLIANAGSSSHLLNLSGTWRGLAALSGSGNVSITSAADIDTTESNNTYTHGIYGYVNNSGVHAIAGNITINADGGTIKTATNASDGIHARADGGTEGNITINSAATIITKGRWADGIHARSRTDIPGSAITITNTGTMTTSGNDAFGILASVERDTETRISVTNAGNITTSGENSYGIYASNSGAVGGDITLTNTGNIATNNSGSHGILADISHADNTGNIYITNDGKITTDAGEPYDISGITFFPNPAYGILARTIASGDIQIDVNDTIDIGTGANSAGVGTYFIQGNNITVNANADITAEGWDGDGIRVEQHADTNDVISMGAATATINVDNGATVKATGESGADGIQVYLDGESGSTYDINIIDATVVGGQDGSYTYPLTGETFQYYGTAVQISAPRSDVVYLSETGGPDGTIDVSANGTLDGSLSGTAVRDSDGDMTLTTYGQITGDILGQDGSDIVNYFGGTINGQINGGDDVSTEDNYIDDLNIQNYTGLAADIDYINFENVNIAASTIDFGDSYSSPASINYTVADDATITMTGSGAGDYTINANVENNGVFDFVDGTVGDHLTITGFDNGYDEVNGDLTGTGTFAFDSDFYYKQSDYITVNGNVTANGTIAINDITSYSYDENSNTTAGEAEAEQAANGYILLIEAPNDS